MCVAKMSEEGAGINFKFVDAEKVGGPRDETKQGAMGHTDKNKKTPKSKPSRALLEARLRAQKQQSSRKDDDFAIILPKDHLEAVSSFKCH